MDKKLSRCPFCRGQAVINHTFYANPLYWGECSVCLATGKREFTEQDAIQSWNTRIEEDYNGRPAESSRSRAAAGGSAGVPGSVRGAFPTGSQRRHPIVGDDLFLLVGMVVLGLTVIAQYLLRKRE